INSSNTTHIDDPCGTCDNENEDGSRTRPAVKIKQAPHTDHDGPLAPLRPQQFITSAGSIREAQTTLPGMQSWANIPGWHHLPAAHAGVPEDGENRDADISRDEEVLRLSSASGRCQLQFTSPKNVTGTHGSAAVIPCSQGDATQSLWPVSPYTTSIANHDSGNPYPALSDGIPRGTYDRRPRHKTRPDRYELKDTDPSMMTSSARTRAQKRLTLMRRQADGVVDHFPKDSNSPSFPSASSAPPEKQEVRKGAKRKKNILEDSFKAPNVTQDRLSLPANGGPGFLNRARTGKNAVPDLSFSGMAFLSNDVRRPGDPEPAKHGCMKRVRRNNDTDAGISRYFSKLSAGPSTPNCYSTEKDVPQPLLRQPDNLPLCPAVGALSAGTTLLASELAAPSFTPNATASSFCENSANPSDSTFNPLRRQANGSIHCVPQVRPRMLGATRAMLMAAKTARNISMLDQCRKTVQHAARMVSHEDRGRIDLEVERDYPIPKLASGILFQKTNRAIEEMIRGENQFLAGVCAVFEPEFKDLGDSSEAADVLNEGAASVNETTNTDPDSHLNGPSTTRTTAETRSSRTEINGCLKAAENTASNVDPCQQPAARKVAHATSSQPSPLECNDRSEMVHTSVSHPTPKNRHIAQSRSGDNGTLGCEQLSAPILDSYNQPTTKALDNPIQHQLGPNMGHGIRVTNELVSNELSNTHPFNCQISDGNTAGYEENTENMRPSRLWCTPKPVQPGQLEIEPSASYILHNSENIKETDYLSNGVQSSYPIGSERISSRRSSQQPYAPRPLYPNIPNIPANPLTNNAKSYLRNTTWDAEQMGNSSHLSANYSPYVNGVIGYARDIQKDLLNTTFSLAHHLLLTQASSILTCPTLRQVPKLHALYQTQQDLPSQFPQTLLGTIIK
ncbi:hypothetical protein ACJ72_01551, partial [Emergomyces africanus]